MSSIASFSLRVEFGSDRICKFWELCENGYRPRGFSVRRVPSRLSPQRANDFYCTARTGCGRRHAPEGDSRPEGPGDRAWLDRTEEEKSFRIWKVCGCGWCQKEFDSSGLQSGQPIIGFGNVRGDVKGKTSEMTCFDLCNRILKEKKWGHCSWSWFGHLLHSTWKTKSWRRICGIFAVLQPFLDLYCFSKCLSL